MTIESVLTIIAILVAAVAAFLNALMAIETKRMAQTTLEALKLETCPILGFRNLRIEFGRPPNVEEASQSKIVNSIRVGVELFSAGRIPVHYTMKQMRVTFRGRTIDSGKFLSRGGRILPGSSTFFWHPTIALDPPVQDFPSVGRVQFEYEYSNELGTRTKKISELIEYTVFCSSKWLPRKLDPH